MEITTEEYRALAELVIAFGAFCGRDAVAQEAGWSLSISVAAYDSRVAGWEDATIRTLAERLR